MTSCVVSLANADKRVADLEQAISSLPPHPPYSGIFFKLARIHIDLRLFYHVIRAEREFYRRDKTVREALLSDNCPSELFQSCLDELRLTLQEWDKVLEYAYRAGLPGYILTRIENCVHILTDLAEDLEVASDPECISLFEELVVELAKRQK